MKSQVKEMLVEENGKLVRQHLEGAVQKFMKIATSWMNDEMIIWSNGMLMKQVGERPK